MDRIDREFDFDEDADIGDVLWKGGWKRTQERESEKEWRGRDDLDRSIASQISRRNTFQGGFTYDIYFTLFMSKEIQYLKYQRDEYGNFLNINYQIFLTIFSYQSYDSSLHF